MAAPTDPLIALRAIRLPASEFDLGEQLLLAAALGVGLAASLAIAVALVRRSTRRRGPKQKFLDELAAAQNYEDGERIARQAAALRVYVGATCDADTSRLQGESWLVALDRILVTDYFSVGKGRVFSEGLYSAHLGIDPSAIESMLRNLVRRRPV